MLEQVEVGCRQHKDTRSVVKAVCCCKQHPASTCANARSNAWLVPFHTSSDLPNISLLDGIHNTQTTYIIMLMKWIASL